MQLSFSGMIIRFFLGGAAVVLSTLIARRLGGRVGGIFAAFPAVYLAAILTVGLGLPDKQVLASAMSVSKGALIGMIADIVCALAASFFILRVGWKKGLFYALDIWLISVLCLYFVFLI